MKKTLSYLYTPVFSVWFALAAATAILLCLLPMTQVLGFDYAFIMGIVLPLAAGHIAALCPARLRQNSKKPTSPPWRDVAMASAVPAGALLTAALLIIFINQLWVPPCNNVQGLLFFLMLPTISTLIAVATGLCVGMLCRRKPVAVASWYLLWVFFAVISALEAYHTPAVFSFGPFIGYWPGVWYDRQISITDTFITYRLFNLLVVVTILLFLKTFVTDGGLLMRLRRISMRESVWLAICALTIAVFIIRGETLGHRTSTEGLKDTLSHRFHGDGIDLYFDVDIAGDKRRDIANDAQFSLFQLRRFFDIKNHPRITVFVFKNADQKYRMMGARHTSVAKPWLGQTYIVAQKTPHWTLRHELAHLIAAEFGSGPFRISTGSAGIIPVPMLVEGLAVAATPTHGPLSLHQSAAAMKKLNLLPRVNELMGLGFLKIFSRRAYTAAGSFCLFIHDRFGAKSLRRMYASEAATNATGHPVSELEMMWRKHLDKINVPTEEMENIKYRLDRPALVETRCGREVRRRQKVAERYIATEQWYDALDTLSVAHRLSGNATETDLALFFAQATCNQNAATSHGKRLLTKKLGMNRTLQISEALIDMRISQQLLPHLATQYNELLALGTDDRDHRRIQLKAHFATFDSPTAQTLLQYLSTIADNKRPTGTSAIYALKQLQQRRPKDPLLSYLTARILFFENDWYHAAKEMKRAFQLQLTTVAPAFTTEARFTLGHAFLRLNQYTRAKAQFQLIRQETSPHLGYSRLADDWLQRVEWQIQH